MGLYLKNKTSKKDLHRFSRKLSRYAGEWVVLAGDKIVSHNSMLAKAMAVAEKSGFQKKTSVFKVPRKDEGPYLFSGIESVIEFIGQG